MHFGVDVPHFGPFADPRVLVALARDAEAAGWDGFFLWDHVSWGVDGPPMADPWIALTAIAAATSRIRLGPMVTPLPRRRPTKVARETASLDLLAEGRLILGVGTGAGAHEWEDLGDEGSPKVRGAMLDEGLDLVVRLWSGEVVAHAGTHYVVQEARFLPVPLQQPRIPIWVAGNWPNKPPFRRAARWDGVFPIGAGTDWHEMMPPEQLSDIAAYISAQRTDRTPIDIVHWGISGGRDSVADATLVARYAQAGVTWWLENVNPRVFGWAWQGPWPVEAMRERIRRGPPGQTRSCAAR